jgi:hypothetical protein
LNQPGDHSDLAPWAHPKAQHWFDTLFERSGLLLNLREALEDDRAELTCNQLRSIVALLYMLSIEGIWPAGQESLLQRMTMRIHSLSQRLQAQAAKGKKTVAEHQHAIHDRQQLDHELELLRRKAGISRRVTELKAPPDWQRIWN